MRVWYTRVAQVFLSLPIDDCVLAGMIADWMDEVRHETWTVCIIPPHPTHMLKSTSIFDIFQTMRDRPSPDYFHFHSSFRRNVWTNSNWALYLNVYNMVLCIVKIENLMVKTFVVFVPHSREYRTLSRVQSQYRQPRPDRVRSANNRTQHPDLRAFIFICLWSEWRKAKTTMTTNMKKKNIHKNK